MFVISMASECPKTTQSLNAVHYMCPKISMALEQRLPARVQEPAPILRSVVPVVPSQVLSNFHACWAQMRLSDNRARSGSKTSCMRCMQGVRSCCSSTRTSAARRGAAQKSAKTPVELYPLSSGAFIFSTSKLRMSPGLLTYTSRHGLCLRRFSAGTP